MRGYLTRLAVAVLIVTPVMFLLVPLGHRLLFPAENAQAEDSVWRDFQGVAGFYAGFAVIAATIGSLGHTWLIRRFHVTSPATQILLAVAVGIVTLIPQAAAFGRGYWLANAAAGAVSGLLYGLLVTLIPFFQHPELE